MKGHSHLDRPEPRPVLMGVGALLTVVLFLLGTRILDSEIVAEYPIGPSPAFDGGATFERELAGGEVHRFVLDLGRGDYVDLRVEQMGIDVVATVVGPGGRELLRVDQERSGIREEPVLLVAEEAGTHHLEVAAFVSDSEPGSYRLRVAERRQATEDDRKAARAWKLLTDAELLEHEGARMEAFAAWRESGKLWREIGDRSREALCVNNMALVLRREGKATEAVDLYYQALDLWRQAEDWYGEATAHHNLGVAYREAGENEAAANSYRAALELRREYGDLYGLARTLNSWAGLNYHLGNIDTAVEQLKEGLEIRQSIGDYYGEAASHQSLGAVHSDRGEVEEAEVHLTSALRLARQYSYAGVESLALNSLAELQTRAGDLQQALAYYRRSLEVARDRGELGYEVLTLRTLGMLYERLGDADRALSYYDESLRLAVEADHREWQARALNRIGWLRASRGETDAARRLLERALELSLEVGSREIEAAALEGIGGIEAFGGDPDGAIGHLELALAIGRELKRPDDEARTLERLSVVYQAVGETERAEDCLRLALGLDRTFGNREGEPARLLAMARMERRRDDLGQARRYVEDAVAQVEVLRRGLASPDLRAGFLGGKADHYGFYVDLLMELDRRQPNQGFVDTAVEIAERARARGLLDALALTRQEIRRAAPTELLEREERLSRRINAREWYRGRLVGRQPEAEIRLIDRELEDLVRRYEEVQAEIRAHSPAYSALTQPETLTLAEIQSQIVDDDSALLQFALGEDGAYVWVVTSRAVHSARLPQREVIESSVGEVHALLTERNRWQASESIEERRARIGRADAQYLVAAAALSQQLLGPVAEHLEGRRLLIVADGALQYLPFGALPVPATTEAAPHGTAAIEPAVGATELLVERHEIVYLPSASVLSLLRRGAARREPTKMVAVFADPVFANDDPRVQGQESANAVPTGEYYDSVLRSARDVGLTSFPRLRFSRTEAEAIGALVPAQERMLALDFAASVSRTGSMQLSDYRFLHFATHTLLNNRHPELSGIVLSLVDENGQAQDGFLRLHEIFNLDLEAQMVVLSACQTALGKEVRGEGLLGLARGFMYAGTPRVVASLWRVDDRQTTVLMQRFYRGLLDDGLRPAAALREAQLSMWQAGRQPYEWAGFVLQGEWR